MKRSLPLRNSSLSKSMSYMDREQRNAARQARIAGRVETALSAPRSRGVMARVVDCVLAVPKEEASQSGAYMMAAKSLGYCMRCGCQVIPLTGELDFCHADEGKGMAIKTDVRRGWPGCRRCHETVGRELSRPVRRAVEYLLGVMTRAAVSAAGLWPKTLPMWEDRSP